VDGVWVLFCNALCLCEVGGVVLGWLVICCFFFQAEDGIRDLIVTGVQTCALPILGGLVAMLVAGVMLGIFALGDFAA